MTSVNSVLGPIPTATLGRTLTHEHFSLDFEPFYVPPPMEINQFFVNKISLETVGFIKQYPYSSHYNINFEDNDAHRAVLKDVALYKQLGGGTICENTIYGLKRDFHLMQEASKTTGVHVIAGTGHYIAGVQEQSTLNMNAENIAALYLKEMTEGIDIGGGKKVKCGYIGEVGSSWPIHDFEKSAIKATAAVQQSLGCGVSFHPGRNKQAPFEIIRLYLEEGGNPRKCIMSHLDRTLLSMEDLLEFAKLGVYIQFDLFGTECSLYQFWPDIDMPSDAERINKLHCLIDEGLEEYLLMSHDIHTKHRLTTFGGHGYSHIITNILPKMELRGITKEQIDQITIKNPANWIGMNL